MQNIQSAMLTSGIALFLWFHLEVTKEKCIFAEARKSLADSTMKLKIHVKPKPFNL